MNSNQLDINDILNEIAYAYESKYRVRRYKDGIYEFHKLEVRPDDTAQYKSSHMKLVPGTYQELVDFFTVIEED